MLDQAAMDATAELNEQYDDADLVTRPVDEEQVRPPLRCAASTQPGLWEAKPLSTGMPCAGWEPRIRCTQGSG